MQTDIRTVKEIARIYQITEINVWSVIRSKGIKPIWKKETCVSLNDFHSFTDSNRDLIRQWREKA